MEDMMKKIHSLIAVSFCTFALSCPALAGDLGEGAQTVADRVSWSELMSNPWHGLRQRTDEKRINVVEIGVNPAATKVPGALAAVWPEYEAMIGTVRDVVARDRALSSSLKSRGYNVDDVLGLARGPDGAVALFVGSSA
jgi:hypothetical protein